MKKINIMLVCFLALNFFSCSSDDDSSAKNNDAEINAQEDEPLEINKVSSALVIEGATKKTGSLTPTGGLEFTMDYSKQSAFQQNGFEIEFNSDSNYTGAYIQLKDENGMADSYFDVPRSEIYISGKGDQTKKDKGFLKGKSAGKENDAAIEVNLEESVTAGTFCYVICLYDSEGNISEPTEVCVTVEAWGGNSDLVGTWNFTKDIEDGKETKVNEVKCYNYNADICEIETAVNNCDTINSLKLELNSDGTYELNEASLEKNINWEASNQNCQAIYEESNYTYKAIGKWAYSKDGTLTLLTFSDTETYDEEIYDDIYENGDIDINDKITLNGSSLIVNIPDTDDNGNIFFDQYFFEKE